MTNMEETSFDPRRRRLCPDGGCVGLIGDNGRCKVCGLPAGGVPRPTDGDSADDPVAPFQADPGDGGTPSAHDESVPDTDPAGLGMAAAGFNPNRRLCDDGACVGVVGADGLCNVCGRKAE